jgi:acetylornithine deacetylase/succinyl-diaminopimelate desuccinylase-like protein
VADQSPSKIADLLVSHINKVAPPGVTVTAVKSKSSAMPYLIPSDHRGLKAAASVLKEIYAKDPYRICMGGSIPANAMFLEHLKAYTIIFAFGLQDERQHSPNEFFRLSSYDRGQKAYGMLLNRLAGLSG